MADLPVQCGDCGAHYQLSPEGDVAGAACSECGGKRFFRSQPSPVQSDGEVRNMVDSDSQQDQGGNPLGEGTIMGRDGEESIHSIHRDNFMHSHVSLSHREMRPETLNMEPYPVLWSDEHVAGGVLDTIGDIAGGAAGLLTQSPLSPMGLAGMAGPLMKGVLGGGQGQQQQGQDQQQQQGQQPQGGGIGGIPGLGSLMGGGEGGLGGLMESAPEMMAMFASADIPLLIMADLETPHSVKSVDEQHDDPEEQDQKEFDDGDKSPSNMKNPNNQDSGASGEDGVRNETPGYGFGPDSPGIQRMEELMPLLMHYITNGVSGADDPVVQGLHKALEQENPGYLDQDNPDGQHQMEIIIQQHRDKQPHGVHASVEHVALEDAPMPDALMPRQQQSPSRCPLCGGILAGDGSCPQCGFKMHPQGGQAGAPSGGQSMPPAAPTLSSHQGPTTKEQKDAVKRLIDVRPELFGDILNQIQNQPNTAPLVDPGQAQAQPPPPMENPQGAMPMPDPSQPQGGMQQPMQPMAKQANSLNDIGQLRQGLPQNMQHQIDSQLIHEGPDAVLRWLQENGIPSQQQIRDKELYERAFHAKTPSLNRDSRFTLTEINPVAIPAADRNLGRPQEGQQQDDIWQDAAGNPLVEGQIYSLKSPQFPVPDEVEIVFKKPHELGVRLVGQFGNIHPHGGDAQGADFIISPQDLQSQKYSFEPAEQASSADNSMPPMGGTPGMEQIPEQPTTTDEISNSYPNRGTTSALLTASDDEEVLDEDLCHKCGGTWVEHTASTPTRTMHECARCGTAWETEQGDFMREANHDLGWLMENKSYGDDFWGEYERAQGMQANAANRGRNIADIAAKDGRLNAVHEVLDRNAQLRTAGRHYNPSEQRALINENGRARNIDKLDLEGTHYVTRFDPTGKANGANVPDEHLVFSL